MNAQRETIEVWCHAAGYGGWTRHARGFVPALRNHYTIAPRFFDRPSAEEIAILGFESADQYAAAPHSEIGIALGPMEGISNLAARVRIASIAFETTRIPWYKLETLQDADEIWVPTAWGRTVLIENGIAGDRIAVVPEGVDTGFFAPAPAARAGDGIFRFLCVGKWEERKGIADLLRAYSRAFAPDAPVELLLCCTDPYHPESDVEREVAALHLPPHAPVRVIPPRSESGLVALYNAADAFVLPTRGEGWGLPIIEAMACGLPAIVTDYSGHTAFVSDENAYLLRVERMVPVYDEIFFNDGADHGDWAQPDVDHLIELLRHAALHPEEARAKGERARRDVVERWTWDAAAAIAAKRIEAIVACRVYT